MKENFLPKMAAIMLAAGLIACGVDFQPIVFEPYEIVDGGNYMIEIDIPQGDGEKEQNAIKGIREIIAQSKLGSEVGEPSEGTLQEVMEDYHKRYNKYAEENVEGPRTPMCDLTIKSVSQNEACVTFLVYDGIHIMGDPDYYKSIVRLSDGHVVSQQELVNISIAETMDLIRKYITDETRVNEYGLKDGYWFSPSSSDSCLVMWAISRAGFGETTIPLSDIKPYLTEEGKKLFSAKTFDNPVKDSNIPVEEAALSDSKNFAIQGELGIFELRGPVKECIWNNGYETYAHGFDKNGRWISKNGQKPWAYQQVVERDEQGRITKMGDSYGEQYESFAYNDNGLIAEHVMKEIDGFIAKMDYFYNDEWECTKTVSHIDDPLEGSGEDTIIYTIIDRDTQGNWIKRKKQDGQTEVTETRKITYF